MSWFMLALVVAAELGAVGAFQCEASPEFQELQKKMTLLETKLQDLVGTAKPSRGSAVGFYTVLRPLAAFVHGSVDRYFVPQEVLTNVGSHLSMQSGKFTAPLNGLYFFTLKYNADGVVFMRNNEEVPFRHRRFDLYVVTLELNKGDEVYVYIPAKSAHSYVDLSHHEILLSGFLIHEL